MRKRYSRKAQKAMDEVLGIGDRAGEHPLEFVAREGARLILTVAVEEEVAAFLGRDWYERRGEGAGGYRNGSRPRSFLGACGEVTVEVPRVRGAGAPFRPQVLERWPRRSEAVTEAIPLLFVEGLSTRDFDRALKPLMGTKGLSKSNVSRMNLPLKEAFQAWRKRDLSEEEVLFLFLDGFHLGVGLKRTDKIALLVAHGVRRDGSRVLLSVHLGGRESTESWKEVLHDLVDRGLKIPALVVSDGNAGLIRAVKEVWPGVARQRCTAHRMRNVLARVPRRRQEEIKKQVQRVFYANSLEEALEAAKAFSARYRDELPEACRVLGTDLQDCLTYFRFPPRHWKRIRTSNVIERTFREVRRRTNVTGRLPNALSALSLVWAVLEQDRLKWRGLHMDEHHHNLIALAVKSIEEDPIEINGFEWLEAA